MKTIDLFCGAGGLSIGLELAGFEHILLLDNDKRACETVKYNRPNWNVVCNDITSYNFSHLSSDLVTGGFPCQSFSYAGKKLGLEDTRGTLFYEFARAIQEIKPKYFLAENVKGLMTHDKGKTYETILKVLSDLGYTLYPKLYNSMYYNVPQKRERIIIVGVQKDIQKVYTHPEGNPNVYTVKDALFKGRLYDTDVPLSEGSKYSEKRYNVMKLVPEGGNWRDLPEDIKIEYMGKSLNSNGGMTGIARRLDWNKPCLTLLTSPSQKQTERCHPDETRPLTIREYGRIQTFPDEWKFVGSISSRYKQIGNAVPVNMAYEIGKSIIKFDNNAFQTI